MDQLKLLLQRRQQWSECCDRRVEAGQDHSVVFVGGDLEAGRCQQEGQRTVAVPTDDDMARVGGKLGPHIREYGACAVGQKPVVV